VKHAFDRREDDISRSSTRRIEPPPVCRRAQLLRRMSHHEQDDEQVLPRSARAGDDREVLNGIFWCLRSGAPWADMPARHGPTTTVYNCASHNPFGINRWRKAGVWDRLMDAITKAYDSDVWAAPEAASPPKLALGLDLRVPPSSMRKAGQASDIAGAKGPDRASGTRLHAARRQGLRRQRTARGCRRAVGVGEHPAPLQSERPDLLLETPLQGAQPHRALLQQGLPSGLIRGSSTSVGSPRASRKPPGTSLPPSSLRPSASG
jgi:transposase